MAYYQLGMNHDLILGIDITILPNFYLWNV